MEDEYRRSQNGEDFSLLDGEAKLEERKIQSLKPDLVKGLKVEGERI